MARLGLAITKAIITEYGKDEILRRLSDPFRFQYLGAVMGMDWHSSGITTSVMGALNGQLIHMQQTWAFFGDAKPPISNQKNVQLKLF